VVHRERLFFLTFAAGGLASNMRSVMKKAVRNTISDVVDALGSSAVVGATMSMRHITDGRICLCLYGSCPGGVPETLEAWLP
jgi:hypothetical protein